MSGVSRTAFRINAASFSPRAVQPAQHFLPGPSRQENAGEYCNSRIPTLHQWHADTVDALVLGFTGPRLRPHHLVLAVGDEGGPTPGVRLPGAGPRRPDRRRTGRC